MKNIFVKPLWYSSKLNFSKFNLLDEESEDDLEIIWSWKKYYNNELKFNVLNEYDVIEKQSYFTEFQYIIQNINIEDIKVNLKENLPIDSFLFEDSGFVDQVVDTAVYAGIAAYVDTASYIDKSNGKNIESQKTEDLIVENEMVVEPDNISPKPSIKKLIIVNSVSNTGQSHSTVVNKVTMLNIAEKEISGVTTKIKKKIAFGKKEIEEGPVKLSFKEKKEAKKKDVALKKAHSKEQKEVKKKEAAVKKAKYEESKDAGKESEEAGKEVKRDHIKLSFKEKKEAKKKDAALKKEAKKEQKEAKKEIKKDHVKLSSKEKKEAKKKEAALKKEAKKEKKEAEKEVKKDPAKLNTKEKKEAGKESKEVGKEVKKEYVKLSSKEKKEAKKKEDTLKKTKSKEQKEAKKESKEAGKEVNKDHVKLSFKEKKEAKKKDAALKKEAGKEVESKDKSSIDEYGIKNKQEAVEKAVIVKLDKYYDAALVGGGLVKQMVLNKDSIMDFTSDESFENNTTAWSVIYGIGSGLESYGSGNGHSLQNVFVNAAAYGFTEWITDGEPKEMPVYTPYEEKGVVDFLDKFGPDMAKSSISNFILQAASAYSTGFSSDVVKYVGLATSIAGVSSLNNYISEEV